MGRRRLNDGIQEAYDGEVVEVCGRMSGLLRDWMVKWWSREPVHVTGNGILLHHLDCW